MLRDDSATHRPTYDTEPGAATATRADGISPEGRHASMSHAQGREGPEAALRRESAHLKAIIDTSLNAVIGMDGAGRITTWSRQAEATFGWRRGEVMGCSVADTIIPPEFREAHRRGLRRTVTSGRSQLAGTIVCVRALHRDGHRFPAELAISPPIIGKNGELEFIAFVRDVSDRDRAERLRTMQVEVTRTMASADTLEGAGEEIVASIAAAVRWPLGLLWLRRPTDDRLHLAAASTTGGGGLRDIAARSGELLLAADHDLPGRAWALGRPLVACPMNGEVDVSRRAAVTAAEVRAAIAVPIQCGEEIIGVVEIMGHEEPDLDHASLPLLSDLGAQIGQFVERVRMAEDLAGAHQELSRRAMDLERSNTDLEEFARTASHDLQEPLRMVACYTELLSRRFGDSLDGDGSDYISYTLDGVRRMQALIADLLAYSRAGHNPRGEARVDTNDCIAAATANLRVAIEESGASITCGKLPPVVGDPTQVTQLFQNLIANALKFRGPASPRVVIGSRREGAFEVFSVKDNGIGIEPRQQENIFKPFQRLHGRDRYGGSGLGLALCRKLVDRLGGRVWVDSTPGMGSTFRFSVPVTQLWPRAHVPTPRSKENDRHDAC